MFYATLLMVLVTTQFGESVRASRAEIYEEDFGVCVHITCDSAPLDTPPASAPAPLVGRWREVMHVLLTGCSPPAPPDSPTLAHALMARGARPLHIATMKLLEVPPDARFNASHFEGLDLLRRLTVQAAGEGHPEQLDGNYLQSLPQMGRLSLENEALPPLSENIIHTMKLERGRSLNAWGYCNNLIELELYDWHPPMGFGRANGWLTGCKRLTYVRAERMKLNWLRTVLSGLKLHTLQLSNNALTQPDLLALLKDTNLTTLDSLFVMDNNLTDIKNVLESQTKLRSLDLTRNMVINFTRILRTIYDSDLLLKTMKTLVLDHNPLRYYCDSNTFSPSNNYQPVSYIQFLSLVGTNTSELCFSDWRHLRHINLSSNNIEELQFGHLPLNTTKDSLEVDLLHNPLREVHFDESNYYSMIDIGRPTNKRVTVYTDPLPPFDCDCKNAWLGRALQEGHLILPARALCHDGKALSVKPRDTLKCDLKSCEPCACRKLWEPPTVIMRCDAVGLRKMPSLPGLGELHLKGNQIDTIQAKDLPATLTLLDVRDNNVSRVDKAAAEALFEVLERRVWFAGNPIACKCDNWPMLNALQTHHIQVEDYNNVTCEDGLLLRNVTQKQLCSDLSTEAWVWVVTGSSVLTALLALLGLLYTRYHQLLKLWLYARGWCLICVHEEDLDTDRKYDAFVSFAHGDHEFVSSQLLPGLEDGPHGYRLCVHYRDWIPGELIPTQIIRSVASSRRTLVVLSANFVQSMWGIMEFRAAYVSALAEGRARLLVVVLENAPPTEELPEELKMYLRSTTYLHWDDPWFWQKLRYALPHRTARNTSVEPRTERVRVTMPPESAFEIMLLD